MRRRAVLAVAVIEFLLASSLLGFRWMTSSTPVPVADAVERFREAAPSATAVPVDAGAPRPGVYRWSTDGKESAAGVDRPLPERSVRLVTPSDGARWTARHEYSAEHTEWFALGTDEQGMFAESYRLKVDFGPFTVDETVTFDPPVRLAVFPLQVDQRWMGRFEGSTSGSFEGRTFERTTIDIGGDPVEVWATQVDIVLDGVIDGTLRTQVWYAPQHAMAVKEAYLHELRSGPGTYQGAWTITMLSTTPER